MKKEKKENKKVENKKQKVKTENKENLYRKVLVDGGYVDQNDFDLALESSLKGDNDLLGFLYSKKIITPDIFGQAMAEHYEVKYADLNSQIPPIKIIRKIPEKYAKKYRVVLFSEIGNGLVVTSDKPDNQEMRSAMIKGFAPNKVEFAYSLTEDIDNIMMNYREPLKTKFSKIIESGNKIAPEIIDEIISESLIYKASDIHFEPRKKTVMIRFRIDGVLQEAGEIPKKYYENIINRIKVQARLRIDDHFSAQDGSLRIEEEARKVDLRISIVPTLNGEKVVIRVLAEYVKGLDLESLGFSKEHNEEIQKASRKPFGMILVTGPTGSGKTTTLYSLLRLLNNPGINIMTIEDPVEYQITGINQIQVNPKTNLTFSKGLRSIVRQDPDVILVGEIRDSETAEIAVNAALTGHLLFSTFHSNDSATAIPRLLDMGVEPFLLASTLELLVAQRLVRKICEECRASFSVDKESIKKDNPEAARFFDDSKTILYKGKGCPNCNNTGYKGRSAIFEIIKISDEMKDLILKNPSTNEIWELAEKQGAKSLYEDGIKKVKNGVTTLEELKRVIAPPNEKNEEKIDDQGNKTKKTEIVNDETAKNITLATKKQQKEINQKNKPKNKNLKMKKLKVI